MTDLQDVITVPWPAEGPESELTADGRPRIFLVAGSAEPPEIDDLLVDWVRLPADARDIDARKRALARRASGTAPHYLLDRFGRLHHGGRWVMIHSTVEQSLLKLMLDRLGEVICFNELFEAGWAGDTPTANALRVQITRLNRRIAPLGLVVTGLRSVGYVLEVAAVD